MNYILQAIVLSCTLNNGDVDYKCVDKKVKCIQESRKADLRDAVEECI